MQIKTIIYIALCLVFFTNMASASEQKRIYNSTSFNAAPDSMSYCGSLCESKDAAIDTFLASGWKIVSSSQKEIVAQNYESFPFKRRVGIWDQDQPPRYIGCTCKGTEYVIEKNELNNKIEPTNELTDNFKKENELLVKENDLLKREIEMLKKENSNLAAQSKKSKKR
ncbi:MAG: hypothetical protein PHF56_11550 [Desulfuromonadaceae bacterium]|nr:hypothetical protein [Desulfuromonadaceae bacterium]